MGSLPRGNNCLPRLFQALSAPLGTHAPQAAWSPSSAPRDSIRMNLDRVSARPALLGSEELGLGWGSFSIPVTSDFSCLPRPPGSQRGSNLLQRLATTGTPGPHCPLKPRAININASAEACRAAGFAHKTLRQEDSVGLNVHFL